MPPLAARRPPRRRGGRPRSRLLGELALGLLLGIAGGWVAGLLRVPRP